MNKRYPKCLLRAGLASLLVLMSAHVMHAQMPPLPCRLDGITLTGELNPCISNEYYSYTTNLPDFGPGTSYTWSVPEGGADIQSIPYDPKSKNIRWTTPGVKHLEIRPPNCAAGTGINFTITVGSTAVMKPVITGPTSACLNTTSTFSAGTVPDPAAMHWELTNQTTREKQYFTGDQFSITWTVSATYLLDAYYDNGQCKSHHVTKAIFVGPPSPVSLSSNSGTINTTATYNAWSSPGTTFSWSISPSEAGTLVSGGANPQITWGSLVGTHTLTSVATNSCGSASYDLPIKVSTSQDPEVGPFVKGQTSVCTGASYTYEIENPGTTVHTWKIPQGSGTINGGSTTATGNSVSIVWNARGLQTLQVYPNTVSSGNELTSRFIDIKVQGPIDAAQVSEISGGAKVCSYTTMPDYLYTIRYNNNAIPADAYNYNVRWSLSDGTAGLIRSSTDPLTLINWAKAGSFTLTAQVSNSCAATMVTKTMAVTVGGTPASQPLPSEVVSGPCTLTPVPLASPPIPPTPTRWETSGIIQTTTSSHIHVAFVNRQHKHYAQMITRGVECDEVVKRFEVTLAKKRQTILMGYNTTPTYGTSITLETNTSANLPIIYSTPNTAYLRITATPTPPKLDFIRAGTATLYANAAESSCYYPASPTVQVFTIKKANQTLDLGPAATLCSNNDITLPATTPQGLIVTYKSSDITIATVSGNIVKPLKAGSVVITGTQAGNTNYTSISAQKNITVKAAPVIVATDPAAICDGQTINIPISADAGASISWGTSVSNVSGPSAGSGNLINQKLDLVTKTVAGQVTYNVTALLDGCSSLKSIVATVEAIPIITITPATASSICTGESTNVTLSANLPGTNLSWSIGSNTGVTGATSGVGSVIQQTLTNTTASLQFVEYVAKATRPVCSSEKIHTVNVKPTAIVIAEDKIMCSGMNAGIQLSSNLPSVTFSWQVSSQSNVSGGATSGTSNPINEVIRNGTNVGYGTVNYAVKPIVSGDACAGPDKTVILKVAPVASITSPTTTSYSVCSGEDLTISPVSDDPGATFRWTAVIVSGTFEPFPVSGTSSVTGPWVYTGSSFGIIKYFVLPYVGDCTGTGKEYIVVVKPSATPSISGKDFVCTGTGTVLSASPDGGSYNWSNGKTTQSITVTSAGTYTVNMTHSTYCMIPSSASKVITSVTSPPPPTITIVSNTLCTTSSPKQAMLVSSTADSYLWTGGATSPYITVTSAGTYSVTVTKSGCTLTASKYVPCASVNQMTVMQTQKENTMAREAEELSYEGEMILIYPNPADDELIIELAVASDTPTPFRLINPFGQPVVESVIPARQQEATMKTKDFAEGMFVLEILQAQKRVIRKVMIMH